MMAPVGGTKRVLIQLPKNITYELTAEDPSLVVSISPNTVTGGKDQSGKKEREIEITAGSAPGYTKIIASSNGKQADVVQVDVINNSCPREQSAK